MKLNKMEIKKSFIIRSKANSGELAKQYVFHLKSGEKEAIMIKKLVLVKAWDCHKWGGFIIVKLYKPYYLMEQIFEIKPKTLILINKRLFD